MTTSDLQFSQSRFGFKLDFVRDSENPTRVFWTFLKLIDFCKITDKYLLDALDADIETVLVLSDIEQGSISVWLKLVLGSQKDIGLDLNLQSVCSYLIYAKYVIIAFLKERTTINRDSEISELQNQLLQAAADRIKSSRLLVHAPLTYKNLLSSIDSYQAAINEVNERDKLYYLYQNSELLVNTSFNINTDTIDDLLAKETQINESKMILKIKKPDYLGKSKWEFKYNKKTLEARVDDLEWLAKFRNREIIIYPGDAIRAIVQTTTKYSADYEVLSIEYNILHIIEIIEMVVYEQKSLFNDIHDPD